MDESGWAADLATALLRDELPTRWAHSRAVAERAEIVAARLGTGNAIVDSAWLHDIGYASSLAHAGFHPIDGARYLRDAGLGDATIWTLVAHHSCAVIEAAERNVADALLTEFPVTDSRERYCIAALTYCDMTTGPEGQPITLEERLTEALSRYGPGDVVYRSLEKSAPLLREQCAMIETDLSQC